MAEGIISSCCICLLSVHTDSSDVCQGSNVISCVIPVNLDYSHNGIAYFKGKKKMDNLLVEHETGEILIIDLRSITNCLLEMLFHLRKSVKIDGTDMKHLCFNFLSIPLVSHRHTCGPAHRLGEAASFDTFFFSFPF